MWFIYSKYDNGCESNILDGGANTSCVLKMPAVESRKGKGSQVTSQIYSAAELVINC
jgi:hypothetical protein